jgi:drug/metabolite transporter (DMT)-like permease
LHPVAVGLVLVSAVLHVAWNYQVKRSPAPVLYTWWIQVLGALILAPIALWRTWPVSIPWGGWACVAGTGLLYVAYFGLIAQSYRREDLSRAYPIARGVAPLATALLGVLFHGERPSLAGWLGIALISLAVFGLGSTAAGPKRADKTKGHDSLPLAGILAAVGVGLCTSGYSAIDKQGVQWVPPVLYIVLTFAMGALLQGATLWRRHGWRAIHAEARRGGAWLLGAAAFSSSGYLIVLEVLRTAPVSYVVPLRSVSVLLSVLAGAHFLSEGATGYRLIAAAMIVLGITAIAVGG